MIKSKDFTGSRFVLPYVIRSITDVEKMVADYGFVPMFGCGIRGFSIYENTPNFWSEDSEGPWEWKGPTIRDGNCAYGKFFNRKAGYVSLEWLPDFLNYRRTRHLAPDDDAAAMDDIVLQTIQIEKYVTIQQLRRMLGLNRGRRKADDLVDDAPIDVKVNLDTNLTRLMMEGRVVIADFVYNVDKRGVEYGFGIAKYTTPEALYGNRIKATCNPEESAQRILRHLAAILPGVGAAQLRKILG